MSRCSAACGRSRSTSAGHGLSEHRDSYGYADYERDLLSLIDKLALDRVLVVGHSLGGYVALLASTHSGRIGAVLAIDVKSDWTEADAELGERSRDAAQRVEPDRDVLIDRVARSLQPVTLAADELELLAERSIEPVEDGWRFRWDRGYSAPSRSMRSRSSRTSAAPPT